MKTTKENNPVQNRVLTRFITIPYEDKYLETARRPGITSALMKRFQRIDRSIKIMDQDGRTAIALYKRKIKTRQLSNLESAIESLEANVTPVKGAKHSFHLGPWRRSKQKIHKSEDLKRVEEHYAKTSRTPLWENKAMKHVVKKVHTWLWHADNQVYNDYASVEAERYFGEAYLMAVLNKGGSGISPENSAGLLDLPPNSLTK
jgi:hypothetical protein